MTQVRLEPLTLTGSAARAETCLNIRPPGNRTEDVADRD
jgi:hypothetical protein